MNLNSRRGWWALTIITMIWLLWMTLRPDHTLNQINLVPLAEHNRALTCLLNDDCISQREAFRFLFIDVLGNIVVFIPLGIGLAGILHQANFRQTVGRVTALGFLFSLTIELTQLAIPTRASDIDDLIFNTLGVCLGVLIFVLAQQQKVFARNP